MQFTPSILALFSAFAQIPAKAETSFQKTEALT